MATLLGECVVQGECEYLLLYKLLSRVRRGLSEGVDARDNSKTRRETPNLARFLFSVCLYIASDFTG